MRKFLGCTLYYKKTFLPKIEILLILNLKTTSKHVSNIHSWISGYAKWPWQIVKSCGIAWYYSIIFHGPDMHQYSFESVAWVLVKGSAVSEMSQHAQFIRFCANGSILMRKYHDVAKPMIKMMMASFCERCPLSREGSGQTLKLGECYRSDECLNVQFELIIYSGQRYIFLYTHTRNVPENRETVEKIKFCVLKFLSFDSLSSEHPGIWVISLHFQIFRLS